MAVVRGAPLAAIILFLSGCFVSWLIFRFFHKRALAQLSSLNSRISGYLEDLARRGRDIAEKDKEIVRLKEPPSLPPPLSQSIFHLEQQHWSLGWKAKGMKGSSGLRQFTPEDSIPSDAELVLEVHATIIAIPPQRLHDLQLEIMGKRLPEEEWQSRKVDRDFFYLYFHVPPSIPQGKHQVCLVATLSQNGSETKEYKSPLFDVHIARS